MQQENRIERKDIYIRILQVSDVTQSYVDWLNDKETNRYLETHKTTIEELYSYVQKRLDDSRCHMFGIFRKSDDKHIGNIKIESNDEKRKCTCLGILIGESSCRGKGYGAQAVNALAEFVFERMKYDILLLGVMKNNIPAIKCYRKCGFILDSELPERYREPIKEYLHDTHMISNGNVLHFVLLNNLDSSTNLD